MSSRRNISLLFAAVFLCLALVSHTVGFSAEYWSSWSTTDFSGRSGLWRICICERDNCDCSPHEASELPHWFRAVQAMMCMGLLGQVLTAGLAIFTVAKSQELNKTVRLIVFGSSIAAGILIWIGLIVYILKVDPLEAANVDFSVFLCAAGGILSVMSACPFGTGYIPPRGPSLKEEGFVVHA